MTERVKVHLAANKSLVLNNHEKFWMVTKGTVDVYYVTVDEEGEYTSQLSHLYRAEKGELLFSLLTASLSKGIKLVAVSSEANLLELNKNELLIVDHTFLKFHINKWILKLADKLYTANIPRIYTGLGNAPELGLAENEIAYPMKGLLWCTVLEGEISKYADSVVQNATSTYSYPFPVSNKLWVKSTTKETNIKVLDTKEVLKDEIFFMLALNNVQEHFYQKILETNQTAHAQEKERIASKIETDGNKLEATLQELGCIVTSDTSKNEIPFLNSTNKFNNPVLAACQQIGQTVDFDFVAPKFMESYNDSMTNQLFAIGQASNVRIRKVILRGTWWKEENGHMLAFSKENKKPIALLQHNAQS